MNPRLPVTCLGLAGLALCLMSVSLGVDAEQLTLTSVLPKLEAIHEDTQNLLIKNREIKAKILLGFQAQNAAKLTAANDQKQSVSSPIVASPTAPVAPAAGTKPTTSDDIDYVELGDFNKWVDANLEYAVKNTQASIEDLKEEAAQANGLVDYSEQAIQDGIEGVKYWQSAVIFQDKTLKNEKFDTPV